MVQCGVISGYDQGKGFVIAVESQRKWSDVEKEVVIAETVESSVSAVARHHKCEYRSNKNPPLRLRNSLRLLNTS